MTRSLTLLALLAVLAPGEIVDRVAVSIGQQVITESEIRLELRLQAFIQGEPVKLDIDARRTMADRLVEQALVRRELEFARFAPAGDKEIEPALDEIRERYRSGLADALAQYQITADQLKAHVAWTVTMLRFVEYRFQPSVQISAVQLRQEYQRQEREWKSKNQGEFPLLEQVQGDIEKIVRQRLVDAALDHWLGEARTQNAIVYHGEYKL